MTIEIPEFNPHWLWRGGHSQTIMGQYLNPKTDLSATKIHKVKLTDGDELAIHDDCPADWQVGDRIGILVHGLGGDHMSCYAVRLANHLNQRGVRSFRVDLRLSGDSIPTSTLPCNAGQSNDLLTVIKAIAELYPGSPIDLVGYSMGGNIVLKTSAELPKSSPVHSCVAVCPPIDLAATVDSLNWRTAHYTWFFLYHLIGRIKKFGAQLRGIEPSQIKSWPKSIREFDEVITAPLAGYKDADDYYSQCSSKPRLAEIKIPTAIFAAKDDPLVPIWSFDDATQTDFVSIYQVNGGGHIGFISEDTGQDPDNRWIDWRILDCLENFKKRGS